SYGWVLPSSRWDSTGGMPSRHLYNLNLTGAELHGDFRGNYEAFLNAARITDAATGQVHLNDGQDYLTSFFFLPGDANHDRIVNMDDYGRIDFASPIGVAGYSNGDFNLDGKINQDDYGILDFNYGTSLPPPPTTPNSLTASAGRDAGNNNFIQLNWTAPQDVNDIDGYEIYRSGNGGLGWSIAGDVDNSDNPDQPVPTTFTDTGMGDGAQRIYFIRAHSASQGYSVATNR